MEISNNQVKTSALEDINLAKAFVVKPDTQSLNQVVPTKKDEMAPPVEAGDLEQAVSYMNDHVQNLNRNLLFTIDEATGKDIVTVTDSETDEIIRQIPSEEALELARRLQDNAGESLSLFKGIV